MKPSIAFSVKSQGDAKCIWVSQEKQPQNGALPSLRMAVTLFTSSSSSPWSRKQDILKCASPLLLKTMVTFHLFLATFIFFCYWIPLHNHKHVTDKHNSKQRVDILWRCRQCLPAWHCLIRPLLYILLRER